MTTVQADPIREANAVARRHFGEFQWQTIAMVAAIVALNVALFSAVGLDAVSPLIAIPVLGIAGFYAYIALHEAAHDNISRSRWVNDLVGIVAGQIILLPLFAHRPEHRAHHAHTNEVDGDPDTHSFTKGRFTGIGALHLFAVQFQFVFTKAWPNYSWRQRAALVAEITALVAWRVVLIALFGWQMAFTVIVPLLIFVGYVTYVLAYLVHNVPERLQVGRWVDTMSYTVDHLPRPVAAAVRWAWAHHNVHGIHHLYPSVPWYRMSGVFDEIRPTMAAEGAPIRPLWDR